MHDPIIIAISLTSLIISILSFSWQHLLAYDSVICTIIEISPALSNTHPLKTTFEISFANLGNRPILLKNGAVNVYTNPDFNGIFSGQNEIEQGQLPRVIKGGEMCSVRITPFWSLTFLANAAKAAEQREVKEIELYFQVTATAWNRKGVNLSGLKHHALLTIKTDGQGWKITADPELSFKLIKKQNERALHNVNII